MKLNNPEAATTIIAAITTEGRCEKKGSNAYIVINTIPDVINVATGVTAPAASLIALLGKLPKAGNVLKIELNKFALPRATNSLFIEILYLCFAEYVLAIKLDSMIPITAINSEELAISANCRIFKGGITGGKIPALILPNTGTPFDFRSNAELIAIVIITSNNDSGR